MYTSSPIETCPIFFLMMRPPPSSTLFPYTTLFRSDVVRRVRSIVAHGVRGLAGAEALVAGFAASNVDTQQEQIGRATSELQSPYDLVCRLLLEKKKEN